MSITSLIGRIAATAAGALMLCSVSSVTHATIIDSVFDLTFGANELFEKKFPCNPVINPALCNPTGGEATRTVNVTNNTGVNWTDFHLRVMSDGDAIVFPPTLLGQSGALLYMATGTEAWLLGPILNGGNFSVTFKLKPAGMSDNLPEFMLFGTPSIPEPGTLALFGLGLAGLGFARRRRKAA